MADSNPPPEGGHFSGAPQSSVSFHNIAQQTALIRQLTNALRSASADSAPTSTQNRPPRRFRGAYTAITVDEATTASDHDQLPGSASRSESNDGRSDDPDSEPGVLGPEASRNGDPERRDYEEDLRNVRTQYARLREHFQNSREGQTILNVFISFLPFLLIFLAKGIFENATTIFFLVYSLLVFLALENRLMALLAPNKKTRAVVSFMIAFWFPAVLYNYTYVDGVLENLIFRVTRMHYESAGQTFLLVVITDFVAKFLVVLLKGIVAMIPESVCSLKRKRRIFQTLEYSCQLYRALLPIPRWTLYFTGPEGYTTMGYFDLFLLTIYWIAKIAEIKGYVPAWLTSLRTVMRNSTYGVRPSHDDLREIDSKCSICYDELKMPLKLICNHIFCEECVDTWLDEKHTCPMCRATIDKEDKTWKNGATSKLVRLY